MYAVFRTRKFDKEFAKQFSKKEQEEIERLVAALRALAEKSEKWAPEILDKVRVFEEGWSGLEREVEKGDVLGEIDYYQGIIET